MSELFDVFIKRLDPDLVGAIGERLGMRGRETSTVLATSVPTLLGAMTRHAQTPEGAAAILDRVDAAGGGVMPGGFTAQIRGKALVDATDQNFFSGMLGGGIFDALVGRLGIGAPAARRLLGLLGPLIVGALGSMSGGGRLTPTRLASLLAAATGAAADAAPGGRGAIAAILGPAAGIIGLGAGGATVDRVPGSVANVIDTVAERERMSGSAATSVPSPPPTPPEQPTARQTPAPPDEHRGRLPVIAWLIATLAVVAIIGALIRGCGDDSAAPAGSSGTTTTATAPATGTDGYAIETSASGAVVLRGAVPTEQARASLVEIAGDRFGADNVTDDLTVGQDAASGPDGETVAKLLAELQAAGAGWTAEITGATVTLTGRVASDAERAALVDAATAAVDPATVVDRLTVAAGDSGQDAVDAINREIRLRGVTFVTGSAELTPAGTTTLDRVASLLANATGVRAQVQGHTDSQGDDAANLALSTARARAVVAYLVAAGIAESRLVARGFGERRPVASNQTAAGRAKNRRVVFVVLN